MGTRGKKPTPREQKEQRGTVRPSREAAAVLEFPKVDECPEAPAFLNEYGRDLWDQLAPMLYAQRILTLADLPALSHLCQLHGSIMDMYDRRVEPTAAERSQLRMYLAEFGLTPSSRQRVSPAGPGKGENPFNRNGSKPGRDPKAPAD